MPLQTEVLLQKRHLHEEPLHTDAFTQTYSYSMISDSGYQFYAREFSKQVQNQKFTAAVDDLDSLCAKGFCGRKQNVNFTTFFFSTIEMHVLQEDQARPSERKKRSNFTAALTIETQRAYAKSHFLLFSRIERHFVGKCRPSPNPHCNFISVV